MTKGSLWKNLFIFSVPLIFSNLLQVLFNIADIAVVGRFAGSRALGSVGSTPQLIFLFMGLIIGLGSGINVIIAYYIGAKDKKALSNAVFSAFLVSLFTGLVLMVVGVCMARFLITIIKTKAELFDGAYIYFKIFMTGIPGLALFNFGNGVLSAAGDTKRPLYFLAVSGILNIILNLFFVIVCHMDCAGVAVSSVISQYVSAALVLYVLIKGFGDIKLTAKNFSFNPAMIVRIVKIGIPAGLQESVFGLANTFVQIGVNSFDAVMVSGTAASSNLDPVVYNVMAAFYMANASFIGQNFGAKNKKRILNSYLITSLYSFLAGLGIGIVFFFWGRQLLLIFTTDAAVVDAGMQRLRIMAFSFCVATFMDNAIAANRGLGKTVVSTIIVFIGSCVFRIVWIFTVFAYFKTIPSLFLLYVFSWIITAIPEIIYFAYNYRKATKEWN